jgi:hypothetical protein
MKILRSKKIDGVPVPVPAAEPEGDPFTDLAAKLAAELVAVIDGVNAEHDAQPVTKGIRGRIGDYLSKAAVDQGLLPTPDAPQHDTEAEAPPGGIIGGVNAPSATARRAKAFIVDLAKAQESGRFGPKAEKDLNQPA